MKLAIKVTSAIIAVVAYVAFINTFGVEFGLDAAMQQMNNIELNYAPSAFMRAVNNYGWIIVALFDILLFRKEILSLINKLKKAIVQEENL